MRTNFTLIIIILALLAVTGCEEENDHDISYKSYLNYSVRSFYETDEHGTYLILKDTSDLNSVFNLKSSIENSNWIKPEDFNNKIGIAIIKDLLTCSCPDLLIENIKLKNEKVILNYYLPEYNLDNIHVCDVICRPYLLILIEKRSFTSIDFYENNILVETIDN